ncbi:MAG: trypsin-like peptidase domain-containing protein [Pseudomonadota bacterium]
MVRPYLAGFLGALFGATLLFVHSDTADARVYKWVDNDGNIHYSQKPPPKSASAKSSELMSEGKERLTLPPKIQAQYCSGVRRIGVNVASKMRQGYSADRFLTGSHGSAPVLLVKQIVGFVYGFKSSNLGPGDIGNLVHAQCKNGSYNQYAETVLKERYPDGIPGTTKKKGTEIAKPGAHSGTAWVADGGIVVTNYHVVGTHKSIYLLRKSGARLKAEVFHRDRANDIALLRVRDPNVLPRGLPIARGEESAGSDVFTIGYPHVSVMGKSPKVTKGIVSSVTGLEDDARFYQISVPVQSGNSGGPLFNMNGEVVGVVTAKLNAVAVLNSSGDLPQNVNYALKGDLVLDAMKKRDISPSASSGAAKAPLKTLVTRVQDAVMLVIAED